MTGRWHPVLINYTDRIITYGERDELEEHFMIPSALGSMNLTKEN
jgi:hypothetical protein